MRNAFANLVPRLDGRGNMIVVAKLETDNRVSDPWRTPVGDEQVNAAKLTQENSFSQPCAGVVELGAIVAVAKIVKGHPVTFDLGLRGLGVVGLPGAIVGRFERKPARQNN